MEKLEARLKELKKELRPHDIIGIVAVVCMVVGAILVLVDSAAKLHNDRLFFSGIGIMATVIVLALTNVLVKSKQYDEYYRIKREIRNLKKGNK